MKSVVVQLLALLGERTVRRNLRALAKVVALLVVLIALFATAFRFLMLTIEGREFSWITSVYWTLTVMSTLGFGDITFHTDLGRAFSLVVLLSGLVLLLIVLPFAFIRFFYAPWLEAQIRLRAPRAVPPATQGHVILCRHDTIAQGLIRRLKLLAVPYYVIEPDPAQAGALHSDGVSVVTGNVDSRSTYEALHVERARLVVANLDDATNTNVLLTIREFAHDVPVAAIVEDKDSVDVLELTGATRVLPLKHQLGQHLASRVDAGHVHAQVVGRFEDLLIAEFPVHKTPFAGRAIRDTRLRELTGLSVVAFWERGKLVSARPDAVLGDYAVAVVVGTEEQMAELDAMFVIYAPNENPVVVIGGGKVGRACSRALRARGVVVNLVEENGALLPHLEGLCDHVVIGDAADRDVLMKAGLASAPAVVLTTNDDATNIFLAVYCRRLNPDVRVVSRITHERNLEAIHRAGADFVLSYASLGVKSLLAMLHGRELVVLGEGADLFVIDLPRSLAGKTLAESGIGARTGANVVAIQQGTHAITNPPAGTRLPAGSQIVVIGTAEQRQAFEREFPG